jgi:hypothetical protein
MPQRQTKITLLISLYIQITMVLDQRLANKVLLVLKNTMMRMEI